MCSHMSLVAMVCRVDTPKPSIGGYGVSTRHTRAISRWLWCVDSTHHSHQPIRPNTRKTTWINQVNQSEHHVYDASIHMYDEDMSQFLFVSAPRSTVHVWFVVEVQARMLRLLSLPAWKYLHIVCVYHYHYTHTAPCVVAWFEVLTLDLFNDAICVVCNVYIFI